MIDHALLVGFQTAILLLLSKGAMMEKGKRRKGHVTNAGDIMAFKNLLVASGGSEANNFSESLASNSSMNS